MSSSKLYKPFYENSWALVIGINKYVKVSPLGYARQDAEEIARVLKVQFGYSDSRMTLLIDEDATGARIRSEFAKLSKVAPDDRILFFFAGHGLTRSGKRGEVGFLVPVDGDCDDVSTLIRWQELTHGSELIPAKHLLFLMDACYGGLAITRNLAPGSSRLVKDMLSRYSRQVLTAGKADETVADHGGPRPGHSIFTGHLLDALEGGVSTSEGVITGNAVMAYVYERVAKDPHSKQTPHFGFFDGDGDFIFAAPDLQQKEEAEADDRDLLVQVAMEPLAMSEYLEQPALIDQVKDFISDSKFRIRLDDLVSAEVRAALHGLRLEEFPVQGAFEIDRTLKGYEEVSARLMSIVILLSRWGGSEHRNLIGRSIARLADRDMGGSGNTVLIGLQWYPMLLLMFTGGISAVASENYQALATLFLTKIGDQYDRSRLKPAICQVVDNILLVDQADGFKLLPGHGKFYVPRSEYLYKTLQPIVEDILFLGRSYDDAFDRFEIFYALTYLDLDSGQHQGWGPPGRFAWKGRHFGVRPFDELVKEAEQAGAEWAPLKAGLFQGSIKRFLELAKFYREQLLNRLNWF